jgi:hypothetical protein
MEDGLQEGDLRDFCRQEVAPYTISSKGLIAERTRLSRKKTSSLLLL